MPELALIGGTRGMVGLGIGLLVADRMSDDQRRLAGRILLAIGAISTIPLAMQVLQRKDAAALPPSP